MNQENFNLSVLGFNVAFRPGADIPRIKEAVRLLEERFANQKLRSHGGESKSILLVFLALSLADDLLQEQKKQADVQGRIQSLLSMIEESG